MENEEKNEATNGSVEGAGQPVKAKPAPKKKAVAKKRRKRKKKAPAAKKATQENAKAPVVDSKLAELRRRAKESQKTRRSVDFLSLKGETTIPQKKAIERLRRLGVIKANDYPMFGDRDKTEEYPDEGFEPVVYQGKHYAYRGDPLWIKPRWLKDKEDAAHMAAEKKRMEDVVKTPKNKTGIDDEKSKVLDPDDEGYDEELARLKKEASPD